MLFPFGLLLCGHVPFPFVAPGLGFANFTAQFRIGFCLLVYGVFGPSGLEQLTGFVFEFLLRLVQIDQPGAGGKKRTAEFAFSLEQFRGPLLEPGMVQTVQALKKLSGQPAQQAR